MSVLLALLLLVAALCLCALPLALWWMSTVPEEEGRANPPR